MAHEGFLLDYGANSHTYRVFNHYSGKVEETVDVKFKESSGSQVEQLPNDIGDVGPAKAIKDLAIGHIKPVEVKESTSSTQVEPSTSHQGGTQVNEETPMNNDENEEVDQQGQQG